MLKLSNQHYKQKMKFHIARENMCKLSNQHYKTENEIPHSKGEYATATSSPRPASEPSHSSMDTTPPRAALLPDLLGLAGTPPPVVVVVCPLLGREKQWMRSPEIWQHGPTRDKSIRQHEVCPYLPWSASSSSSARQRRQISQR
jgi:hypothetical protein